jgi:hypothetical protein
MYVCFVTKYCSLRIIYFGLGADELHGSS